MKIKDTIKQIEHQGNLVVLILANGFEIELDRKRALGVSVDMPIEAEFYKNLLLKLSINRKCIIQKEKVDLLPEVEALQKNLLLDIKKEKLSKINLAQSARVKKLFPLFAIRFHLLQKNKNLMKPKDWIDEIKIAEELQNIFLHFEEHKMFEKCKNFTFADFSQLYPKISKFEKNLGWNLFMLTNALLVDIRTGLNPRDEIMVKNNIDSSWFLKASNSLASGARVVKLSEKSSSY